VRVVAGEATDLALGEELRKRRVPDVRRCRNVVASVVNFEPELCLDPVERISPPAVATVFSRPVASGGDTGTSVASGHPFENLNVVLRAVLTTGRQAFDPPPRT